MDDPIVGSGIWTRDLSAEDLRALRLAARRALLRAGTPPELITDKELDKVVESRLESTILRVLAATARRRR